MTGNPSRREEHGNRLYDLLLENDIAGLETLFRAILAGIPYQWHTRNDIADYEGYYASVFYSCFQALGLDVRVEDSSSRGRLDMAVLFNGAVYLFELKVVESGPEGTALAQLRERGYADKYRGRGEPIHLIGVEFSKETRVSGQYRPWLRDGDQCDGGSWWWGPRSERMGTSANSDFHIRGVSSMARVVFHIPSWDPHGNGSDYSVDGFPGMTKQSGNRSERVRSPVARIVA